MMSKIKYMVVALAALMGINMMLPQSANAEDLRMSAEPVQQKKYQSKRYKHQAYRNSSRHERSAKTTRTLNNPYASQIAHYAGVHGVPVKLADAVVRIESRYNPRARNRSNVGLTQVSYRTAQSLGYNGSPANLYDPSNNLNYGIKYLAQAYRLAGGDTCRTIMKYQSGHRAVSMNGANRAYCGKARTIMAGSIAQ